MPRETSRKITRAVVLKAGCICMMMLGAGCATHIERHEGIVATYSIIGFDPATGDLGVAVQSKFFSVGTVVPWAKAGVGAIATQASANISFGPRGLKLLEEGKAPQQVLETLLSDDARRDHRQVGIMDAAGNSASHTGVSCFAHAGHLIGKDHAVQGNILAGEAVLREMSAAFEKARLVEGSELADWLTAALQAGEDAGGDSRGRQSAALLAVREKAGYGGESDRYIDLRVEDHPDPTRELARLLVLHKDFFAERHMGKPAR